jgi:hypothetical protein
MAFSLTGETTFALWWARYNPSVDNAWYRRSQKVCMETLRTWTPAYSTNPKECATGFTFPTVFFHLFFTKRKVMPGKY